MQLEYTDIDYKGNEVKRTTSIANYLADEILLFHSYHRAGDKISLEDQPERVAITMGRLIEKLMEKGLFNLEDLKYIADSSYGRKTDSLAVKNDN